MFASVIILYHPTISLLLDNLTLLEKTGWATVIVDNSPTSHRSLLPDSITYFHCPENVGIAEAQNIGLAEVRRTNMTFAMLLDQDSQLTESLLRGLQQSATKANKLWPNVAAIGPQIVSEFDQKTVVPFIQKPIKKQAGYLCAKQIIASGMVITMSALTHVGLKESSLFIDGVDHEWCWRAKHKGYEILIDSQLLMIHKQGDARKRLLGFSIKVGQPIRLYYQFRNVLLLVTRHYVPVYWKVRNLLVLPCRWGINRFILEDKQARGKFMWRGLKDGFKRVSGPFEEQHSSDN